MATNTFHERLDVLEATVGHGDLTGQFTVNQPYAAKQHTEQSYKHPRGGGPDFVTVPLVERHESWFHQIAGQLLNGTASVAMADAMEDLSQHMVPAAPIRSGDLRGSGHPVVFDGARLVYDRPPAVPRRVHVRTGRRGRAPR